MLCKTNLALRNISFSIKWLLVIVFFIFMGVKHTYTRFSERRYTELSVLFYSYTMKLRHTGIFSLFSWAQCGYTCLLATEALPNFMFFFRFLYNEDAASIINVISITSISLICALFMWNHHAFSFLYLNYNFLAKI